MNQLLNRAETERLSALAAYGILDTPPETSFEHITSLVTRLFKVPAATVTLIDSDRQWFKSVRGLNVRETARDISFCDHAIRGLDVLVVPDATLDPRFANNPLVVDKPRIRFYAGAPLRTPEGHAIGAMAIFAYEPRQFSRLEKQTLTAFASLVEDELLLRRVARDLRTTSDQDQPGGDTPNQEPARMTAAQIAPEKGVKRGRSKREPHAQADRQLATDQTVAPPFHRFGQMIEHASDAIFLYDVEGRFVDVNTAACNLVGYEREELLGLHVSDIEVSFDKEKEPERWHKMVPGEAVTMEGLWRRKNGEIYAGEVRVSVIETEGGRLILALARDISARKQAERLLQVHARQQQAVASLGTKALGGAKVDALLDEAVGIVGRTLELEICVVLEHVPERQALVARAVLGLETPKQGEYTVTEKPTFATGYVLQTGHPIIIEDVDRKPPFKIARWLKANGGKSGLGVPIGGDGSGAPRYGVLAAYSRVQRGFSEDDVNFVQSMANILATAIARQRGEDALREVEARYRRIAANTPGIVYQYLKHPDGHVTLPFVSEASSTIYGMEPQLLYDNPQLLVALVHPEDKKQLVALMQEAENSLTPLHWEGRHVLPDGAVRWIRIDSRPEGLPGGGVICDGIIIDITAQKQAEEALRQTQERFRLANLHSPLPVMLHADDGEVLQVNDAWIHRTGYTAQELGTVRDWIQHAYPSEEAQREAWRFLAQLPDHVGALERAARRIRCADGQERIWDLHFANLGRLPDGRCLRITTAVDVTQRHQDEMTLRAAKEEAERANKAKSIFLSRMSHELRTPLNAILGFGQLLELGRLDEEDAQAIHHILKGGRYLLSLVDEVLDLARVEAGELALEPSSIFLNELAQECLGFVARMAQTRKITCTLATSLTCHRTVWADEQRLRQVLLNLLSNAIKYNRDNGRVILSCKNMRNGKVRLQVRDTGAGISPEDQARLFVPFERLGQELGEVEGTGLGLVVSRRLVEAMGGSLGVTSRVNRGSTFWLELPVAQDTAQAAATAEKGSALALAAAPADRSPVAVLYIEDNPSNVQVMKTVVERLRPHWKFSSARDGLSGLQQVLAQKPDLILLDLQLPGMKGDAVLSEIRADRRTTLIPVLMLSADAMKHSRERLLALGATDYISKPFNIEQLLHRLDALLLAGRK